MKSLPLHPPERVCVFRALQLGDMLCAVPALRALRALWPEAEITLVGLPWASAFQKRFSHYVDRFVEFAGWPGLPERPPLLDHLPDFLRAMRAERFSLAVQLHGSGRVSNRVVSAFQPAHLAAFTAEPLNHQSARATYLAYPSAGHEIHRNLALARHLGAEVVDDRMEFPVTAQDRAELAAWPQLQGLQRHRYICLHPGARDPAKRWSPAHFAQVGDALARRGFEIVITGSEAERGLAATVQTLMQAPARIAACEISVGGLAALLADARLLVSNDTGIAHVACGLHLPSVIIFFATDPQRWAPLDRLRHRVVHQPSGVSPGQVLQEVDSLLKACASERNAA